MAADLQFFGSGGVYGVAGRSFPFEIAAEDWLSIQTVSICGYLEPLSAVVFSVLLFGGVMLPVQIFGAVFILGGAVFGEMCVFCKGGIS